MKKRLSREDEENEVQREFEEAKMMRCFLVRASDIEFIWALIEGDPMCKMLMAIIHNSLDRLRQQGYRCLTCDCCFKVTGKGDAPAAFGILATGYLEEDISAAMTVPVCDGCCKAKSDTQIFEKLQQEVRALFPEARMLHVYKDQPVGHA